MRDRLRGLEDKGQWTEEGRPREGARELVNSDRHCLRISMEVKQNLSEGTGFSYWRPFLADDTMGIDLVGVIFPISFSLVKCLVLKVKGWVLIIKNCCVKITILKKEERKRETWMEELWTKRIGNLSLHKSRNVDTFTFNGLNLVEKRYPKLNVVHVWETSRGRETLVRFVRWNRMDKVEQSYSWLFN